MCADDRVAVVITNYNCWDLSGKCARQSAMLDAANIGTLLVYDDCSASPIPADFPSEANVVRGPENRGLVKSLNAAIRMTKEEIIVIFDADAYPVTPFCQAVTDMFAKDPQLGLLALRTIGKSGQDTESYTPEPVFWSILLGGALHAKVGKWLRDRSGRLSVFTCAMAVRRKVFEEVGGFDEGFDWLDLDHDFSMRVSRSGWTIAVCPEPRVFHEGGGSPQLTRKRVLRFYKNRWRLLRKFDRIPAPDVVRRLIALRLRLEYLVLLVFGRFLFRDARVREDKILGRRELIHFWSANIV